MTILIDPYRFGAGSGGGFTDPTDFAGLQLWLAADVAGLGTGAVTTWPDQSGQGHDATGQGTTKPAKVANVVNGLPVIRFNGSTSYFTLPDYMGGFTASTWFATLKLDNYPTVSEGTAGLFTMDTSSSSTFYPYPGAGIFLGYGTTDRYGIFDPGTSLSAWHRLIITVDSLVTGNWRLYLNGVSIGSESLLTVDFPTTPILGKSRGPYYLDGDCVECGQYNVALDTDDIATLDAYLAARVGS